MAKSKQRLLIFVGDHGSEGHRDDFRFALNRAFDKIPYSIFEDIRKTPESTFNVMMGGILFSDAVLLDGTPFTNSVSPDVLIHYGICFALEKKCVLVHIKNSSKEIFQSFESKYIESYFEFDYYLDFATQSRSKLLDWLNGPKPTCKVRPNKLAVHSFITFGIDQQNNPDLYETVSNMRFEKKWMPRIVANVGHLSILESLVKAVSQRSFCLFCLNKDNPEEIFLGIGLAIGMGRPFLVIKHKDIELPSSLRGYHGIIEYEYFSQLKEQLNKYAEKFLSDEVFNWEGATYNDLLSQLEKNIGEISPAKLDKFESVLLTVSSVLEGITAKPFALLGEIYREKNYKVSPENTELLMKAKDCYEKALSIQKNYQLYQNAVVAIDKHIQLIELIKDKKYRSIPILINLIGGEIKSDNYYQVKEYLLSVVSKLVEDNNFLHAISLLAAMQIHDRSEQIQALITKVIDSAPQEILKALQDSQKYALELENEKTQIITQVKEKDARLDEISIELQFSKSQTVMTKEALEQNQKERDELGEKLKDNSRKLEKNREDFNKLKTDIKTAKNLDGRGVIVHFGYSWAVYEALKGKPYVIRNNEKLSVKRNFVLKSGDQLIDDDGIKHTYLGPDAIVIDPKRNRKLYTYVASLMRQDEIEN